MPEKLNYRKNIAGFSFLDLLIIMIIFGTLAAIAIPQLKHYNQRIYDRASKKNLENLFLACKTYWTNDISARCSLDIAKEASNGYIQSPNIAIGISLGKETKNEFHATAKHNSSKQTYSIDLNGNIR
jgi:Tfp pilus assembly protein PilE